MKFAIGSSNFYELITNNCFFADHSEFIKAFFETEEKTVLVALPRRWGKSLNLSMLQHFFTSKVNDKATDSLFSQLIVNKQHPDFSKLHQGKYQVITANFKDVKSKNFSAVKEKLESIISQIYKQHSQSLISSNKLESSDLLLIDKAIKRKLTDQELKNSLRNLCKYLYLHHDQKVIILIDEYDTPLTAATEEGISLLESITQFMREFLTNTIEGTPDIEKVFLTGILSLPSYSILSGVSSLKVHNVLASSFSPFYGFSDEDISKLVDQNHYDAQLLTDIKRWYSGYMIAQQVRFNPWSIINCLDSEGIFKPHWVLTSDASSLKDIFTSANFNIKKKFTLLLAGQEIEATLNPYVNLNEKNSEEAFWSLFLFAGYLNASDLKTEGSLVKCKLSVPNFEISQFHIDLFCDWLTRNTIEDANWLTPLLEGKVDEFDKNLKLNATRLMDSSDTSLSYFEKLYLSLVSKLILALKDSHDVRITEKNDNQDYLLFIQPKKTCDFPFALAIEILGVNNKDQIEDMTRGALTLLKHETASKNLSLNKTYQVLNIVISTSASALPSVVYEFEKPGPAKQTRKDDELFDNNEDEPRKKKSMITSTSHYNDDVSISKMTNFFEKNKAEPNQSMKSETTNHCFSLSLIHPAF